ncbi:MAG: phosphate ABC transporter ATP-binding protein [Candidatus Improbicoccus pseudotrichonymphae]|uniref:Phosphate ABC transporter ATP-binding protein n=1 Tax=Candidatus Improbicoccus pseudotrichonymphae TaxID=3033792 RepID=A0AA48IGL4_9FIRM|nr:MAG: phosphate ABC transporter ATP-binding protein [Candidatus Improbicoccus pseudotrichonymphae]
MNNEMSTEDNEDKKKQIVIEKLNFYYESLQVLKNIDLSVERNTIVSFVGPSGCGKSTCLRTMNRMNDLIHGNKMSGKILIEGQDIYAPEVDVTVLRKYVGMVFQKPNPFNMSIYDNVAYGPRVHGIKKKKDLNIIVENSLKLVGIWENVKDRLKTCALRLSGGQQQRICIARTIAVSPKILLMDEPTSALDPNSTLKIENFITELKKKYTVIIVTHNMHQASRISDKTAFFLSGELIEYNDTFSFFNHPKNKKTDEYITGRL